MLHRSGLQFFEVASYAVATGLVGLVVFRALLQRPFGAVWDFPVGFPEVDWRHVILGAPAALAVLGTTWLLHPPPQEAPKAPGEPGRVL